MPRRVNVINSEPVVEQPERVEQPENITVELDTCTKNKN